MYALHISHFILIKKIWSELHHLLLHWIKSQERKTQKTFKFRFDFISRFLSQTFNFVYRFQFLINFDFIYGFRFESLLLLLLLNNQNWVWIWNEKTKTKPNERIWVCFMIDNFVSETKCQIDCRSKFVFQIDLFTLQFVFRFLTQRKINF